MKIGIIGGGIAGLSLAFRLAKGRHEISVFDPAPAMGSSLAAAGMLAPASEVNFGELPLLGLMRLSNEMWGDFAAELESLCPLSLGLRNEGTLVIGKDGNDSSELERLEGFQKELQIAVTRLTRSQLKELEPELALPVAYAALIESDRQVDNRALLEALQLALQTMGVEIVRQKVVALQQIGDAEYSFRLADSTESRPEVLVIAAGSGTAGIEGLPDEIRNLVRPVKGQIMRVRTTGPILRHVIRAKMYGKGVYMVPRVDGQIVIGATQEEVGFDETAKVRPIAELLTNAVALLPSIGEADFSEHMVRFRPGSTDNAPVLGRYRESNIFLSLGHFRHGILLSAAVSYFLARQIDSGKDQSQIAAFGINRFMQN